MWRKLTLTFGAGMTGLLLCSPAGYAQAGDDIEALERRVERLEAQVQQLLERAGQVPDRDAPRRADSPAAVPPAAAIPKPSSTTPRRVDSPATVPPAVTPTSPGPGVPESLPMTGVGEALVAYYLTDAELGADVPAAEPMARGLVTIDNPLLFAPERYGVGSTEMFSGYDDPSRYRSAGILLTGYLELPYSGTYHFTLAPKPAREGGGSPVVNAMRVRLDVGGEAVIDLHDIRSWRHQAVSRELPGGRHRFSLWVTSVSPGYGASPVDSSLGITVRLPGRSEFTPLHRFMMPAAQ